MSDGIDSAAATGGSTLFDVKLSNLQQRIKDNAAKIAEDVTTGELQQRMRIKITEDVVTAYETIKESETLHLMIKESTLDKLLVGRGTLDQVLAEEVEEWNPVHIAGSEGGTEDKDKENSTTSNVHESYMQKSSSYLKELSRNGGNAIVSIGSSSAIADAFVDVNSHLTQYFNVKKLGHLGDMASEAGGVVLEMVKDPLARNLDVPLAKQYLAKKTGGKWTMASNRSGWNQPADGDSTEFLDYVADDENKSVVTKLVVKLCGPGGTNAEPPMDKLEEFILILPTLKHDEVCLALLDTLKDGNPWLMKAKALCVIETVILLEAEAVLEGGGGDDAPYFDFLRKCTGPVEQLANHSRESVSGPARRVLEALGHIVVEETSPQLDDPEVNHVGVEVSLSPHQQQEVTLSMFSGFNTKAASQIQQMQKAYQESKMKMQVQATKDLRALKQMEVPSLSSWKPPMLASKSTKQQLILDAL